MSVPVCVYDDVWREWERKWVAAHLPLYIRFAAAYLGLRSYRVLQYIRALPPRILRPEEAQPVGQVFVFEGSLEEALPMIERGDYIVFRPEDDVVRAWRAASYMAPLLAPDAATVKLVHTSDGVLVGASPLPAGERRIVEAVIINSVQVSDKARREVVKCPRCGQEGKVSVIVRVRHGVRSCTVIRHPAGEAAATAAEAILTAGEGGS
ncbi:MAG: hypothetical protein QXF87_07615 [Thermofilaceae archaeon]